MQYGPPPLFKQGIPAKARLIFYSLLAVVLILVDSRLRVLEPLRSNIRTFISPIQSVVDFPFTAADAFENFFSGRENLQARIDELRKENETLKLQVARTNELLAQNEQLRELLLMRKAVRPGAVALVEIKGAVGDRFSRNIILDHGSNAGIRPGMPVIDNAGLLGQVSRVYPEQCELVLLTSRNVQVPIQFERTGLRAIAEGVGETDLMKVLFVPLDADVVEGDTVTTSGIDGVFPRKTAVGTVSRIERIRGEAYMQIELQPAASVATDRFARVLLSPPSEDLEPELIEKKKELKPQRKRRNP